MDSSLKLAWAWHKENETNGLPWPGIFLCSFSSLMVFIANVSFLLCIIQRTPECVYSFSTEPPLSYMRIFQEQKPQRTFEKGWKDLGAIEVIRVQNERTTTTTNHGRRKERRMKKGKAYKRAQQYPCVRTYNAGIPISAGNQPTLVCCSSAADSSINSCHVQMHEMEGKKSAFLFHLMHAINDCPILDQCF